MARCRFLERVGSGCGQQLLPKIAREGAVMGSSELTNADKGRYISFVGLWREWGVGCSACVRCGVEGDSGQLRRL